MPFKQNSLFILNHNFALNCSYTVRVAIFFIDIWYDGALFDIITSQHIVWGIEMVFYLYYMNYKVSCQKKINSKTVQNTTYIRTQHQFS